MTLTNQGSVPHTLTGAHSMDYAEIGIHQTKESHGMSSMHPVDSIEIKPKMTVRFGEQGYHLMLMKPTHELHPGERVLITLQFASEPSITVPFAVCAANATGSACTS
jgi:copper(I)-binding protein